MASSANSTTVSSADGTELAVTATGSGPAVVVVDGALSYRAFNPTAQAVAEALADRYTVCTFDRRGRGESGDADAYTVQAEIADMAAVINHAGDEAALLGFSSGAVLALEAALAALPVSGLALYEPPFVVSADRPPVAADYRDRILAAVEDGRPGDAVAQFLTESVGMPTEFVEPMRAEPFWGGMEQLAPTLAYDAAVMGQTMSGDSAALRPYASVTVPTLVMYGGKSDAWMAAAADAIAGVVPGASTKQLAGQDHDVSPEALVPVLAEWLPTLQG